MKIISYIVLAACLLFIGYANASTSYPLPDPSIAVNPNYSNTTTIVTIAGVTYRGPSAFYYGGECAKPDGPRYHCNVMAENGVVLKDANGNSAIVNLTVQFASTLITSGHNYWRQSQLVMSGDVTVQ